MSNKFVVGGGWSLSEVPFESLKRLVQIGEVYGVNEASVLLPCHYGLTMDRLWFENRFDKLDPIMEFWVREKCDCNVKQPKTWRTFTHCNLSTPSMQENTLHGGNSGTCAINLAMQTMLEGDTLYLLGFDMCKGPDGQPYWHKPYSWASPDGATKNGHFNQWVKDMAGFAAFARSRGLRIYNVSTRSKLECFQKLSFDQMMRMV
jgi:hypothetical protein